MKKVLIFEDNLDTLDIISYLLEDYNIEVCRFQEIIEVTEIKDIHPDLILIDYRLPNGYGTDLCLAIKSDPLLIDIPVILMSAHGEIKRLAKDSCFDDYLEKPFDIALIIKKIKDHIEIDF